MGQLLKIKTPYDDDVVHFAFLTRLDLYFSVGSFLVPKFDDILYSQYHCSHWEKCYQQLKDAHGYSESFEHFGHKDCRHVRRLFVGVQVQGEKDCSIADSCIDDQFLAYVRFLVLVPLVLTRLSMRKLDGECKPFPVAMLFARNLERRIRSSSSKVFRAIGLWRQFVPWKRCELFV